MANAQQKTMQSTVDPAWTYGSPMEPIPEEDDRETIGSTTNVSRTSQSPGKKLIIDPSKRTIEQKQRTREVYTSEQVDTLVSTVPKEVVPDSWNQFADEQIVVDPDMTSTYITENLAGPASARGTTYSYTYESHVDDPEVKPIEESTIHFTEVTDDNVERHSKQTQKVTRVTKITTTRSVRQVPVNPSDIFFDADGNPVVNGYAVQSSDFSDDGMGIDLSKTYISEQEEYNSPSGSSRHPQIGYDRYFVPSAPGVPQVIDIDSQEISLAWLRPDSDGTAGPVIGYRVEFRHYPDDEWEAAHDDLLLQTECRITNLDSLSEYQFRVLAANTAGFGLPSSPTLPIQPRSKYDPFKNGFAAPVNPKVVAVEGDRCTIEWQPPISHGNVPVTGYIIEYRVSGTSNWVLSNDYPVSDHRYDVTNLRPNGEYEFRIIARYEDGTMSEPSFSTGFIKVKPSVPIRTQHKFNSDLIPPGQPQVLETDSTWVQLHWSTSPSSDFINVAYVVEMREIGDPTWYTATTTPIPVNELIIENLHSDSTYEFRVSTVGPDGSQSEPSETSDIIRLRPITRPGINAKKVPERPSAPEYLDFDGGNSVTLCWMPAKSVLPVEGYEVEFRDFQQDATQWFKVTDKLVYSCKTTVGYLIHGHQYQFRIIAKNANGYSEPSDASTPITIGKAVRESTNGAMKEVKYVEAERFGTISLLQDEIVRESPPLPDRDDSPPPIYRQPNSGNLQWRDPTLKEVIDYLKSSDPEVQRNASGYLQHLTYNDNVIKEETRNLNGIPLLVRLLDSDKPEIQRNACGCLKNLAFGKENDQNKEVIMECNGVKALGNVIKSSPDNHVKEEATGALWNISSYDNLKEPVLNQVVETIINQIVIPLSGFSRQTNDSPQDGNKTLANIFRNGTGILRNVSAANNQSRFTLRKAPNLIESLIHFLKISVIKNQVDTRAVENVVCILRNLSYRVEEVVNPKYNPNDRSRSQSNKRERSKSAPTDSPKTKKKEKKGLFKKSKKGKENADSSSAVGPFLLWNPQTVQLYLKLLQESSNSDTLEASAAAIQNLAACDFDGSQQVRVTVRQEKGLGILTELLKVQDAKVLTAVATALRNLVIDQTNCEIIGKNALSDLIDKLPRPDETKRNTIVTDPALCALLGILFEIVKSDVSLTRNLHEQDGTTRLRYLAKRYPQYGTRVCKYASQVLFMMWQHKELHDGFKRSGLKEADFYSGSSSARSRDATTLSRPISSQGAERPVHLRSENMDESGESAATYAQYGGGSQKYGELQQMTPNSDRSDRSRGSATHRSATNTPQYYQVRTLENPENFIINPNKRAQAVKSF
uniref:Fibronectin type-III domain-containing protein n=1 Tax=Panagrolaimus sp. JU765 TaxID=591449 RepID=A0AC34QBT6_9BILA